MHKRTYLFLSACTMMCLAFNLQPATAQSGFRQIAKFGTAPLTHLAWSPDGNMLAVLNLSTIILYTSAFKKIAEFDSGPGGANQIAWSPDGKYLAGAGNFLWIWNITSLHWQVLRPFNTKSRAIFSVVWSPDGTRLLTDAGDIWDVKSGKIIATLNHDTVFTSVSWSPDGTHLATAYENFAGLWDAKTYRLQDTLAVEPPLRMEYLAWSADSKSLAGTSEDDQQHEINVWNVESTKRVASLNIHSGYINALAWSPDNKFLANSDDHLHVWDTTTWQQKTLDEQNTELNYDLAWDRDGTLTSLTSKDVIMWNTNTGQRLQTLGSDDHVADAPLSWSQDSKKVILGVGTILQIRDGTTGTLRQRFDTRQEIKMLAVSPTVPLVAVTDGSTSIQVWNLDTEQLVQTLIGFTAEIANPDRNMKWSPDGTRLAVLSLSGSHSTSRSLVLWDANTWKSTSTFPADCFSWSPDSKTLAIGLDTSAYTVDSKTGSIITKLETATVSPSLMEPIDSISWSLRGDRIADQQFVERGSGDVGEDLIWDAKTGKIVAKEPLSKSFYWHPKGKLVARTLVILDPAIDLPGTVDLQIYNLDTKANLHLRNTYFDAWSPDGKRFVVNNDDYTIRVWGQ